MQHYLMIFIFLFSSLSSQWAGAVSLNKSATESVASMSPVSTLSHSAMHHVSHKLQNTDESHDCCPSMQKTTSETIVQCVYCGDNCQCDTGQLCHHSSPLISVGEPLVTTGSLSMSPVLLSIATLPSIALAPEFKPPQI